MRKRRVPAPAALAVAALCLFGAGVAHAQAYDPYGPRAADPGPPPRDRSAVTPFIGMFDGTPRYELFATNSGRSDAAQSGLLAINLQDMLPVDAGKDSPLTTGEHGGQAVLFHYLVKYWETYPDAKEREGRVPQLGQVTMAISNISEVTPPPAVKAVLDRQAAVFHRVVMAYAFIQRSEGVITQAEIRYHRDRDASGREVWGFRLGFVMGYLNTGWDPPVQLPNGRWTAKPTEGTGLTVCSNCYDRLLTPSGRYRGMQILGGERVLVDTIAAPLWVSQYRGGQGPLINNPEVYEAGRPEGEIQMLIVTSPTNRVGIAAKIAPDVEWSRAMAAAWLPDWRALVNEANGPNAPRAD